MAAKQEPSGVDGKYYGLNNRLRGVWASEWKTCFTEIERIIGSSLPPCARRDRGWWGNEESGSQQTQALAWLDAGWEAVEVDLKAEHSCSRGSINSTSTKCGLQYRRRNGRKGSVLGERISMRTGFSPACVHRY